MTAWLFLACHEFVNPTEYLHPVRFAWYHRVHEVLAQIIFKPRFVMANWITPTVLAAEGFDMIQQFVHELR